MKENSIRPTFIKEFYLNEGYYNVKITQSSASIIEDNNFLLTYKRWR